MISLAGSHQLFLVRDYCLKQSVSLVFLFCCSLMDFLWGHSKLVDLLDFNCEKIFSIAICIGIFVLE